MALHRGQVETMEREVTLLKSRLRGLVNEDLKKICRAEGQMVSGVKAVLQNRIIEMLDTRLAEQDARRIVQLGYRIKNHGTTPPPNLPLQFDVNNSMPASSSSLAAHHAHHRQSNQQRVGPLPTLKFHHSPFLPEVQAETPTEELPAMPNARSNVNLTLNLTETQTRLLQSGSHKVLLYGAVDDGIVTRYATEAHISFPQQFEVRVNGDEVKANFRGLKNKTGSTRPTDLTNFIRVRTGYNNKVQISYALTQRSYFVVVRICRKFSVEELTSQIQRRDVIAKEDVIKEMKENAATSDLIATAYTMSLKDPISTLRISIPARSTICTHNACFDVASFLQLQEQAPTWTCPICSKVISFQALAIDQYVEDILRRTGRSTDQVTIQPNGDWSEGDATQHSKQAAGQPSPPDDDSDDVVEITDSRVTNLKREQNTTPVSLAPSSPVAVSREPSITTPARTTPAGGQKRKREVIDLTLSDDDDQGTPPLPTKRRHTLNPQLTGATPTHNAENSYTPKTAPPHMMQSGLAGPIRKNSGSSAHMPPFSMPSPASATPPSLPQGFPQRTNPFLSGSNYSGSADNTLRSHHSQSGHSPVPLWNPRISLSLPGQNLARPTGSNQPRDMRAQQAFDNSRASYSYSPPNR